jgi:hypothetical protein
MVYYKTMNKWIMCVVALILGMLLANMLKNVCGCKVVEGVGMGMLGAGLPGGVGVVLAAEVGAKKLGFGEPGTCCLSKGGLGCNSGVCCRLPNTNLSGGLDPDKGGVPVPGCKTAGEYKNACTVGFCK